MTKNIAVLIFATLGLVTIVSATAKIIGTIRFMMLAQTALGTVIRFKTSSLRRTRRPRTVYQPVVRFTPPGSELKIEVTSSVGSHPPAYQINEQVPVRYLPTNPYRAYIQSFWELWGFTLIFLVVGFLFVGFAYIIFTNGA